MLSAAAQDSALQTLLQKPFQSNTPVLNDASAHITEPLPQPSAHWWWWWCVCTFFPGRDGGLGFSLGSNTFGKTSDSCTPLSLEQQQHLTV